MNAGVSETAPASAPAHPQRTVWLLFAPLGLLAGTRWVLQWMADRAAGAPALPLQLFSGEQDPTALLITIGQWLAALAGAALLAALAWRRYGGAPVRRVLLAVWCVVCLAGTAGQVWGYVNSQTLQPLPPVSVEVRGSRLQKPTSHGAGGTLVVFWVPGLKGMRQVLIDDPAAAHWKPGQWLELQWARGRTGGRFVTGWQALAHAPPPEGAQERP